MEDQALAHLRSAGTEPVRLEREAEMRLAGQFHDILVPVRGRLEELRHDFEREYARLYHDVLPGYEPMVLNWRLRALGPDPEVKLPQLAPAADGHPRGDRPAYFPEAEGFVPTPVYDRYALGVGSEITGPAIVEERESTTVLGPRERLQVDKLGNLRVSLAY
jgi:5-oxoprolinase (ATP-hydrolysing)/N-methylhydantoinase A